MQSSKVYREFDKIYAPEDVPAVGVKRGDWGEVLLEFDRRGDVPAAIEVMFDRADGEPGPCVIYSPDLSKVYDTHVGYNAD